MSDHELPRRTPNQDIRHVKRLWIYMQTNSSGADWLNDLSFGIIGHEDEDNGAGVEVQGLGHAERVIQAFLNTDPRRELLRERTPLDFYIEKACFVVLRLYGNFWEFSSRGGGAIRTKKDLDDRYYHLIPRPIGNRRAAVSFCTDDPYPASKGVRHGINLYVDYLTAGSSQVLRLPVLIDPDIENKGNG